MRKEVLKGLTIFTLMVALAILTAVVSANAQSQGKLTADIPVEFVVGNQTQHSAGTSADYADSVKCSTRVQTQQV